MPREIMPRLQILIVPEPKRARRFSRAILPSMALLRYSRHRVRESRSRDVQRMVATPVVHVDLDAGSVDGVLDGVAVHVSWEGDGGLGFEP